MSIFKSIPSSAQFVLTSDYYNRTCRAEHSIYPTDEEVLASVKVFSFLMDLGVSFRLEMLTAWAVNYFQTMNNIMWARGLQDKQ